MILSRKVPAWGKKTSGFTLIEMLIVIVALGILAMIVIPQISVSQDDTKVSTLKTNLGAMRSAVEVYYAQHGNTYPGSVSDATGSGAPADTTAAATAFTNQLTRYSETSGKADADSSKLTAPLCGPYVKNAIPTNPFNNLNTVAVDITSTDLSVARTADNSTGWKYYAKTGVLFANDTQSSGGVAHSTY
jgi:prepilin-type N-terminal cleavage/methylation domain-containing protein